MAEIKPINNLERVPLKDVVPLDTPFSVYIFPTTFCNFKCVYCAHCLSHKELILNYDFTPQTMTMETCAKIIEQLKDFPQKIKLISFTGHGEPLLNKELPSMISMAKQANVAHRIEIITNAALLTPRTSEQLIDAGLDGLRISFQGMSAEKYKEICGRDMDFNAFVKQVAYFYERGRGKCELFVKVMDVSLDEGEEEAFYQLFDAICDRMHVEKCRNVYEGVAFTDNMREENIGRWGNTHEPFAICPLSFFQLGIFPDGDVEPCDTIYKPVVLGNVHHETLREMYSGEILRNFQIEQLKNKRYQNPKCAVCTAPDDVSLEIDRLDNDVEKIFGRFL